MDQICEAVANISKDLIEEIALTSSEPFEDDFTGFALRLRCKHSFERLQISRGLSCIRGLVIEAGLGCSSSDQCSFQQMKLSRGSNVIAAYSKNNLLVFFKPLVSPFSLFTGRELAKAFDWRYQCGFSNARYYCRGSTCTRCLTDGIASCA